MIQSFSCKETAKIFREERSRSFPADIQARALMKLAQLSIATEIDQMRLPPSNHLEALSGKLRGCWSIRVNRQWRIVFRWEEGDAHDVRLIDYH